jgi:hypothetical protein
MTYILSVLGHTSYDTLKNLDTLSLKKYSVESLNYKSIFKKNSN